MLAKARLYASFSKCKKRKVGAIVVKNDQVLSYGFNHGYDEICDCSMTEKNSHVIHAEQMALCGSDKEVYQGATIYVTYPPCDKCMILIEKCQLKEVIYLDKNGAEQCQLLDKI